MQITSIIKSMIRILKATFICIWISHFLQVLTPETGFDALWYHLPVAKAIVQHGGLVYLPQLYQSVNPLFSDLFFTAGYAIGGMLGAKVVASLFGLATVWIASKIARFFLKNEYVLWTAILISLMQVVAWQSASFYVDVAKAFWELCALYVLLKGIAEKQISLKSCVLIGLFLGASMGTKAFSIVLFPFYAVAVSYFLKKKTHLAGFIAASLVFSLPFYAFAYLHTGDAFYTLHHHAGKLAEIGRTDSWTHYLIRQFITLPYSYIALVFARDYVSPLIIASLPLLWFYRKTIRQSHQLMLCAGFAGYQWLLWWFLPPTSTRYALSGFIVLLILILWSYVEMTQKGHILAKKAIVSVLVASTLLLLIPRIYVNIRSLRYILGHQTQSEYLQQFRDGNIDRHIDNWYRL